MSSLQKELQALLNALNNFNKNEQFFKAVENFTRFWYGLTGDQQSQYKRKFILLEDKILASLGIISIYQINLQEILLVNNPDRVYTIINHIETLLDRYSDDELFTSETDNDDITPLLSFS